MTVSFDFAGRHVFVFGGTTGINLGIAHAFARHGANVTVASRKQENVDAAVAALAAHGAGVLGVTADVRDFDAVGRAFTAAHDRFGKIDVLVSGAAGNFLAELNQLSSNGFKVVVDIDLNGTFHVMRQAFPYLASPGASVINITAPQGAIPIRYQAHVCAAKAGVDQLTRVLAMEWGAAGVRVNAISPGPIADTEGMRRLSPQGTEGGAQVRAMVPLGRLGTSEDIANLAMFLGSPAASFISGAIIPCDGGGAIDSVKPMIEAAAREQAARPAG
ncbi:SDR family oxidoreductase [Cupriavidus sp. L7L]|uniref:SDR family oxidoreductase n=1 Tax=Cupriavidus sp. L7L TaxID=2546443 RepID=UPI001054AC97|nr:SDR family oxidoreductase [Cupriavidus sp. L7L]TDF67572.1 SDR family oxidoreductase [Cupriavidus sp. L7L]